MIISHSDYPFYWGHWVCCQFLAVVDQAAVNTFVCDFRWTCVFVSLGKLLDHWVDIYLVLVDTAKQFSKVDSHQQCRRVPGAPPATHHPLVLSVFLILAILVGGETQV